MTTFNDGEIAAAPPSDGMTLLAARAVVANGVLQLPSNVTDNVLLDQAITAAGDEFMRKVRPVRSQSDVSLTAGEAGFTISVSRFLPRYTSMVQVLADGDLYPVRMMDRNSVQRINRSNGDGIPRAAAFVTETAGIVGPKPVDAYTLRFDWWHPFTTFTPGTASAADIHLNIPLDMIYGVLWYGVPAHYNRGSEQQRFVRDARERFDRHILDCMGLVNASATSIVHVNEDAY